MIKTSILGNNWHEKPYNERLALAMQQKFDLNSALSKIIASRGIALDDVEDFLDPKIKTALPNPFDLLDMDLAVKHAIEAILGGKKITIFADYDVDGATSAAILKRFFAEIGVDVGIYIPDRILEGYGPNVEALLALKKSGTDLVITVDCGTVAFEPLKAACDAGLEIIVIDHHIGVLQKPKALAVINPNRIDETFAHKNICAATVSFLFAVAINKTLREEGFFGGNVGTDEKGEKITCEKIKSSNGADLTLSASCAVQISPLKEPNLMSLLDLVALGTVCDVMPLTGLNRALVANGLKIMRLRRNLGIRALCDVAALDEEPSAYHLGFIVGPRINAGGRVGTSNLGATILSTNCQDQAGEIAAKLDKLNAQRKEIEKRVLEESIENLEKGKDGFGVNDEVIFAASNGWHQGVIGIVASRLKDLYNKPVAVIALDGQKGKASCRSISGIDFGGAILQARMKDLVIEGGGHAMAGGFSVKSDKVKDLHKFFQEILSVKIQEIRAQNIRDFDAEIDLENVNLELIKSLQKLEPFGTANRRPKFLVKNLRKMNAKLIGADKSHISCNFSSLSNVGFSANLSAVAFRSANTALGEILMDPNFKKPIDAVGELNINNWMGKQTVQMVIEDLVV